MSNSSFELLRKHWIWPVLVSAITLAITIYSAHLQYRSAQHEMGGSLMATFYKHSLNNREARTIVVCMEDANVNLRGLYVTPTFDNPSEFSIKDFSLTFNVQCSNVNLVPSSFVEAHSYGGDEWLFRYKDDLLAAHDDTKRIFTDYNVTGNTGHCFIETKASYDGASSAFEYNTDVWFLIVPKKRAQSYEDWKINCKKRIFDVISDRFYDVYYFSHNNNAEYQFDVALSNDLEATPSQIQQSAPKPAPQRVVESKPASTPTEVKPTPTPAAPKKVEQVTTPVVVPPVNTTQDISIVKYSSTKKNDLFTIHYELNKAPTTPGKYLLYGHYTIPGNEIPYTITRPVNLDNRIKSYTSTTRTIDSLEYHLNDLRIIKETTSNGLIEIGKDKDRRTIKNISENKIVIIVKTSLYGYYSDELEKWEVYYDAKDNNGEIHVFDTGEKSIIKKKTENETKNNPLTMLFSDMTLGKGIILFFAFIGLIPIIIFAYLLFETKSFSETWREIRSAYSLEGLENDSIITKILALILLISPIITLKVIIQIINML